MHLGRLFLFSAFIFIIIIRLLFAQTELNDTHWEGAVVRNNSAQPVEFNWKTSGDSLSGNFSIPELGLYYQPVTEIKYAYPVLYFKFLYGKFEMNIHNESMEMTGGNANWKPPVFLHLKQQVEYSNPFTTEEVSFSNKDVTLAGTLFLPEAGKPSAAIVIIHGSGEGGKSNWGYNFWGYFFARLGIAALIYDKRGTGESTGKLESASFYELADDAAAGFEYLKTRKEIDKSRIGLFGSSQGGWLAPLAASRTNGVSFLILNVAPAVSVAKQEIDRVIYTLRTKNYPEQDVELAREYTEKMFHVSYDNGSIEDLKPLLDKVKDKEWADVLTLVESEQDFEDWRLQKYDPAPVLRKTSIPVFVSYAEKDIYVPPGENKDLMKKYLDEAGNKNYTIIVIPGIGHNMFTGQGLTGDDWSWPDSYWRWDKKSPQLLISIKKWVRDKGLTK